MKGIEYKGIGSKGMEYDGIGSEGMEYDGIGSEGNRVECNGIRSKGNGNGEDKMGKWKLSGNKSGGSLHCVWLLVSTFMMFDFSFNII